MIGCLKNILKRRHYYWYVVVYNCLFFSQVDIISFSRSQASADGFILFTLDTYYLSSLKAWLIPSGLKYLKSAAFHLPSYQALPIITW